MTNLANSIVMEGLASLCALVLARMAASNGQVLGAVLMWLTALVAFIAFLAELAEAALR